MALNDYIENNTETIKKSKELSIENLKSFLDENNIKYIYEEALKKYGKVDILVNNAAVDDAELMIADYKKSYVEPELPELEEVPTVSDLEIIYSGKPAVRAGGGYKKFTLKARIGGELTDVTEDVEWSIDFGGNEEKLECIVDNNVFKVKCTNDYSLIGKTFIVTAESEHSSKSLIVEVTSL